MRKLTGDATVPARMLDDAELAALVWQHTGVTPSRFADMTEAEFNFNGDEIEVLPTWPYWARIKFLLLAAHYTATH